VETKEENENRIFPVSDSAKSIWDVLIKYMKENGVKIETNGEVTNLAIDPKTKDIVVRTKNGKEIIAPACVLATGGTSLPETGSTGEGFRFLKKLGHKIIENDFALVPIKLSDKWVQKLSGVTLNDIKLTVFQNKKKQASSKGKILFTHFGASGPTILNMSKEIGELLKYGEVVIELDLFPKIDVDILRKQLQELLIGDNNKKLKNSLSKLIPASLVSALLKISDIDGETANNIVSKESRKKLVSLMKAVPLNVSGLLGANKAIVSSGGVALEEVDFKTMQSRLIPGLYLVGDVLNIDRPSGGYSLQLCWTTGFVAGNNIKQNS
jgi:predicted Rossmann fold flavoprotein